MSWARFLGERLLRGALGILLARRTVDRLEGVVPRRPGPDIAAEAPQRAAPLPAGHAHPEPLS